MLTSFSHLPKAMQTSIVRQYYDQLRQKSAGIAAKRAFDIVAASLLLLLLCPLLLVLAVCIKAGSRGAVFYRQTRVTRDMRLFRIFKFRTMVQDADTSGPLVTVAEDARITRIGRWLRKMRLDELPQLFNVLRGEMSFVGVRPEVPRYVEKYSDEMNATLLLPAGITSMASITFKDEEVLLRGAKEADIVYEKEILPQKMVYNLEYLKNFSFWGDVKIMLATLGIYRRERERE